MTDYKQERVRVITRKFIQAVGGMWSITNSVVYNRNKVGISNERDFEHWREQALKELQLLEAMIREDTITK